jgi:hypothetical protein
MEAGVDQFDGQRQADVSETDDAEQRRAAFGFLEEVLLERHRESFRRRTD